SRHQIVSTTTSGVRLLPTNHRRGGGPSCRRGGGTLGQHVHTNKAGAATRIGEVGHSPGGVTAGRIRSRRCSDRSRIGHVAIDRDRGCNLVLRRCKGDPHL